MVEFLILIGQGLERRLCDWCKLGDHFKCVGVRCYGCGDKYHERKPGRGRGREPWQ